MFIFFMLRDTGGGVTVWWRCVSLKSRRLLHHRLHYQRPHPGCFLRLLSCRGVTLLWMQLQAAEPCGPDGPISVQLY